MEQVSVRLYLLFEDPFWIGVCESISERQLTACKITFGAEPKDYEVYDYLLRNWYQLRFGPGVEENRVEERSSNPKRMQRNVKKQMLTNGIGTKSQQALKLLHEQNKLERKSKAKAAREEEKMRQFSLKLQKRKEKHKGR